MSSAEKTSRIPVPVTRHGERYEVCEAQRVPAPTGKAEARLVVPHWSTTFAEVLSHHAWRKEALDAFVSHSFTGAPGTERWCSRCTLMLPPDWQDPKKPVPLPCGDSRIKPVPAMYTYIDGNPLHGVRLADPHYSGATEKHG